MEEYLIANSAVFPLILKKDNDKCNILLHRRQNTGYHDGKWDIAGGGRVDKNETPQNALTRECNEELGIHVKLEDISFAHLSHRLISRIDKIYFDVYFIVNKYTGVPNINEPDKCSELKWFDIDNLPNDLIEQRKVAIRAWQNEKYYSEVIDYFH